MRIHDDINVGQVRYEYMILICWTRKVRIHDDFNVGQVRYEYMMILMLGK